MKPTIAISPHVGVSSCFWGNTDGENSFQGFAGLVDMYSLGLSDILIKDFEAWVEEWHENFVERRTVGRVTVPFWWEGFDIAEWHSRGKALMRRLQEERPDLEVRNGFDSDVYLTEPVTRKPVLERFEDEPGAADWISFVRSYASMNGLDSAVRILPDRDAGRG